MKKVILLLLMLTCLTTVKAQSSRTITGNVYDADSKQPLPGVTIQVEGANTGTQTNLIGAFSIVVPNEYQTLLVTYIGFETQKIKLKKESKLNVYLKASARLLNEVVVLGYETEHKKDITGSIAKVNASQFDQAQQGRVAGMSVASPRMMIRGIASPIPQQEESYKGITENGFHNPKDNPLSTFSIDVDAASYSNVRRFINNGQLPPKDAVRIEEMINYFNYNLPAPTNNEPVAIHTELSTAPWNPQHRLLRIGLKARVVQTDKLPASNLVFLIDVSGSMSDANKLPLVRSSLKMLVDQLRPQDKVAIVVYAGAAGLVLPSTAGSEKTTIKDAIDRLDAGGSTAGGEGIRLAYKTAKQNFLKSGNNRVILATDGDFNVGASSDSDMEHLIAQERKSGVFLSVLGYGMGNYKDSKMETLADKGNGNYAYIDNITEARKTLVSEFGGTLFTVAKDVKLQLEFNPAKVSAYRLIGYENRMLNKEDFNNDLKDAGDMGAGHNVTALYEIIPAGVKDKFTNSVDPLKYQKNEKATTSSTSADMLTIKFRYKEPNGSVSKMAQATVNDKPADFKSTSIDFRFAAAVAEFGMLLRDSEFKQNAKYEEAINIARAAKGTDHEGYRAEFVRLAESAKLLSKSALAAVEE
ncbi:von Willebrand factor type A domain-containing protein [Mucilaginibacter terrae]|uniref:vWA domain-containing protein n=1 Tax=Mucilaginibacter terrae TaxID=1955052 RepID=UPI0036283C62